MRSAKEERSSLPMDIIRDKVHNDELKKEQSKHCCTSLTESDGVQGVSVQALSPRIL